MTGFTESLSRGLRCRGGSGVRGDTPCSPHLGLMLAVLLAITVYPAAAAESVATVSVLRGQANAESPGAAPRDVAVGSEIYAADKLTTGPDSGVTLTFTDKTTLQLGAQSEFVIREYDARRERPAFLAEVTKGLFRLVTGLIARGHPESVRIVIPLASIGIRGTDFGGEVAATSALIVLLEQGERRTAIDVSNAFGSVTIDRAGYGTEIPDAMSPPGPPRLMRLRAIDNLMRSLSTLQRMQIPRGPIR